MYMCCDLWYNKGIIEKVSAFLWPLMKGSEVMPLTEAQKQARYKYAQKSLMRFPLDVQKEKYEEIKTAADAAGESVNGYIKAAIDQRIERESTDSE